MHFNDTQRAFTLIELLVVIAIVSLLASIILVSLNTTRIKGRDARRMADLKQIVSALELYYDANGYYPASQCGWDCNGYNYSFDSSWNTLGSALQPYLASLPKDPINGPNCGPWTAATNCYVYAYGNVGKVTYPPQYDLTGRLEDTNSPYRCSVKNYVFYFNSQAWCGGYSGQIFEASPK